MKRLNMLKKVQAVAGFTGKIFFLICLIITGRTGYCHDTIQSKSAGQMAQKAGVDKDFILTSPDNTYKLLIHIGAVINYQLLYKDKEVISSSGIALELKSDTLGWQDQLSGHSIRKVRNVVHPLYGDFEEIPERYNELKLKFENHYSLIFRAYELGVAYRFSTDFADSIQVFNEKAEFKPARQAGANLAMTGNLTAWELPYQKYSTLSDIPDSLHAITPALFTLADPRQRVIIAEADVQQYPGLYLKRQGNSLMGYWAAYPSKTVMGSWGDFVSVVSKREPYLAKTEGKHNFPWRVMMVTDNDGSLLTNKLIYLLAPPTKISNTQWIKPGKAAWEWWHDAILPGASIPSGMENRSTQLYNYYIDFAAKYHLEYMMIDAGWSNVYHLKIPNPKVDIKKVIQHAQEKKVGVFLWCVASSLLEDLPGNLDYLADLGAAGLKVDFFDRNDQVAAEWMASIAAEAAKRHLLIDFHGCRVPSGLERTYPNILNYEALRGAECNKWDTTANPRHHLTVPFIRMLAGPIDYTPGAMRNQSKESFKPIDKGLPSAMGTRCHELAMYIIYDQPLAMLCDAPTVYEQFPDVLQYLSRVPTTFDDTRVLGAALGEYAVMAKRSGNDWYIGGMSNWEPRNFELDLSFLPEGKRYKAIIWKDGAKSGSQATDYTRTEIMVDRHSRFNIQMASGGGMVMHLQPH